MNFAIWMLAGAMLGWVGIKFLNFNEGRGVMISMIIGTVGGFFGGKVVAPMFTVVPADFSAAALFFAAAVAALFLFAGNLIHDRWGV